MGKAKLRLTAFDPTVTTDQKRQGMSSTGSIGSRTWDQSNGNGQPQHRGLGVNSKLAGWATSLNFDGNDRLERSTTQGLTNTDAWMLVW